MGRAGASRAPCLKPGPPFLASSLSPSLQRSLLSFCLRYCLAPCVWRGKGSHGLHRGLCQKPRKGKSSPLHGGCACMSWQCPGSAARLLEGCWLGRAAALQASRTAPHPATLRSCWLWLPPHAPSWYLWGCQDEEDKMRFLRNICTVCTTAKDKGLSEGLDIFCRRNKLAQAIMVRGRAAGWGRE